MVYTKYERIYDIYKLTTFICQFRIYGIYLIYKNIFDIKISDTVIYEKKSYRAAYIRYIYGKFFTVQALERRKGETTTSKTREQDLEGKKDRKNGVETMQIPIDRK